MQMWLQTSCASYVQRQLIWQLDACGTASRYAVRVAQHLRSGAQHALSEPMCSCKVCQGDHAHFYVPMSICCLGVLDLQLVHISPRGTSLLCALQLSDGQVHRSGRWGCASAENVKGSPPRCASAAALLACQAQHMLRSTCPS